MNNNNNNKRDQVRDKVWGQVMVKIEAAISRSWGNIAVKLTEPDPIYIEIRGKIYNTIWLCIWHNVGNHVRNQLAHRIIFAGE